MARPSDRSEAQRAAKRQSRGLERMATILDVAEATIADVGYEATTTNLIAERASMSPGSLYKYFANKHAIVAALADRYAADLESTIGVVFDQELTRLPISGVVDRVVDPILAFNLDHPATRSLLAGTELSPELADAAKTLHQALCDRVEGLIRELAPLQSSHDQHRIALVTFQVFAGVLPLVLDSSSSERPAIASELKAVIANYWTSHVSSG